MKTSFNSFCLNGSWSKKKKIDESNGIFHLVNLLNEFRTGNWSTTTRFLSNDGAFLRGLAFNLTFLYFTFSYTSSLAIVCNPLLEKILFHSNSLSNGNKWNREVLWYFFLLQFYFKMEDFWFNLWEKFPWNHIIFNHN